MRTEDFDGVEGMSAQEVELHRNREGTKIAIRDIVQHPVRMPELIANKAYWLMYKDDDGIWAAESYGNDRFIPETRKQILMYAANAIYYATGAVAILGAAAFAGSVSPFSRARAMADVMPFIASPSRWVIWSPGRSPAR